MRKRFVSVIAILAATASVFVALTATGGAQAKVLSGCTPQGLTPTVSGGRGYARGQTTGCTGISYSWQINLSTTTGQVLATNSGTSKSDGGFTAPAVGSAQCIGYHVYSWVWIDVGGTQKTSSSGSVTC